MKFFNRYGVEINHSEAKGTIFKIAEEIFVDQFGTDMQTILEIEDQLDINVSNVVVYVNHGEGKKPTLSLRSTSGINNQARKLTKEVSYG